MHLADAYRIQIGRHFEAVYPTIESIPPAERAVFEEWANAHYSAADRLVSLGWQRAQATEFTSVPGQGKPD